MSLEDEQRRENQHIEHMRALAKIGNELNSIAAWLFMLMMLVAAGVGVIAVRR